MSDDTNTTKRIGKRSTEEEILATWSHVVPGTLRFDTEGLHEGKQTVEIRTRDIHGEDDGNTRRIATSDLFQSFWTVETKDQLDRAKRSAKRKLSTKSRADGLASLRLLDTVEKAQVARCLQDLPRIAKAKAAVAEQAAKLDAKAEPDEAKKGEAKKGEGKTASQLAAELQEASAA
jgi:hypothetical protein